MRSFGQRVGEAGELAFRNFAQRQGLIPTKVEADYGIDFYCQVDMDPNAAGPSSVGDTPVTAFVRASQKQFGGITLTRADAQNLLRTRNPMFVCLVHQTAEGDHCYLHFVDHALAQRLATFLRSDKGTHSLRPTDCLPEAAFRAELAKATLPGARDVIEVALAESGVAQHLTDATIDVIQTGAGAFTVVTTLNYYSYFELQTEDDQQRLYESTFGIPILEQERLASLVLRTGIVDSLERLPKPFVLGGFVTTADETLHLREPGGATYPDCNFTYKSNGENFGWLHGKGLSITVSKSKPHGDVNVHETRAFFDPAAAIDLGDVPDLREFAEPARQGLFLEADTGFTMEVDYFHGLLVLGEMFRHHRAASAIRGWARGLVFLRDVEDLETRITLGFLSKMSNAGPIKPVDFVLDSERVDAEVDPKALLAGIDKRDTRFSLPVLVSTANATIVATLSAGGLVYLDDDSFVGLRMDEIFDIELTVSERVAAKSTIYPELLLHPSQPTIPLGGPPPKAGGAAPIGSYPADFADWEIRIDS